MALCRCGKTGEPSTASRTTEKYRSTSLNSRNRCKTNVFEIRSAEDSHSDHVQQFKKKCLVMFLAIFSRAFLIANFGHSEVILHNLIKVQYTVWISVHYILHYC